MAGETVITVVGNLVDDPELRFTPSGAAVAKFRIASTPRTFDRQTNEWKDGESLFLTCSVWRQAAENVAESLQRGMRVVVQGRLKQRSYEDREGVKRTVYELDVEEVGPSLKNATAKVTKTTGRGGQGGYGGGGQQQGGGSWGGNSGGGAPQGGGGAPADDPWATGAPSGGSGGQQGGGGGGWGGNSGRRLLGRASLLGHAPSKQLVSPLLDHTGETPWRSRLCASLRRRSARSARTRPRTWTTRTRTCCGSSFPTAARSGPAASPATARDDLAVVLSADGLGGRGGLGHAVNLIFHR
ncbi:Single-stranded DNA-binding protein [Streptomyces narbonensis]